MAAAVFVVIVIAIAVIVFTFLTSTEMVGRRRETMARLLGLVPLYFIKIIIVAWQIVTQVRGKTPSMRYIHCLNRFWECQSAIPVRGTASYSFFAVNGKIRPF